MSQSPSQSAEVSLEPARAGIAAILYYRFDRGALARLRRRRFARGREQFAAALDPPAAAAPARLQTSIVSGHKADFGLMLLDADPLKIDAVHQRLMAGPLGPALVPTYSFVSMTEVSEYVPTVEQYGQRLVEEGEHARQPGLSRRSSRPTRAARR